MKLIAYSARGWRVGEDHPRAKYTNHEISLVLDLRAQGLAYREIAARLEMPWATVRDVCTGRIRSEPADHYGRLIYPPDTPKRKGD